MKVTIDFSKKEREMKPMHAVNNGPTKPYIEQSRGNFETYKDAHIPYARTHDASFCATYGGEHTVDVHAIFPDFNQNPYDERSYDFTLTDEYLQTIVEAGTQVFYRLGTKIEHWSKKYGTIVPADAHKWAVICEHIIRHYNEGWANGFHFNIIYWEIWNEPDGKLVNGFQPNWSGTPEEYYELYIETATHLKKRFPYIKVGGPALSYLGNKEWLDGFFKALKENGNKVPLDFFSWHTYIQNPKSIVPDAEYIRARLNEEGYEDTENILNEYNYLKAGWSNQFVETIEEIGGMHGAAFFAGAMSCGQKSSLDMMMYYDARLNAEWNGLFAAYTYKPLKSYYVLKEFSQVFALRDEVKSDTDDKELHVVAATDGKIGKAMITYFNHQFERVEEKVEIVVKNVKEECRLLLLDENHTFEEIDYRKNGDTIEVVLKPDSVLLLECKKG